MKLLTGPSVRTIAVLVKSLPCNSLLIKSLLVAIVLSVSGCGGESTQLPPNATVEINPSSVEWQVVPNNQTNADGVTTCVIVDDFYQDELISVQVLDNLGRGIEDAELIFSLNLTGNTFTGFPVLSLYHDANQNFVADPGELVSSAENDLFVTHTEEYTGAKYVIVRMNLSCPYEGMLRVFSDGISASAVLQVTER